MRQRCTYKAGHLYKYYGARGIRVCDRWDSYDVFFADMGEKPAPDYELDRIDVNGNYEPKNCRWANKKTQQRNQRRTVFITHNGVTKKRCEWAEELGVNESTIRKRLVRGHTVERALSQYNHRMKHETKL